MSVENVVVVACRQECGCLLLLLHVSTKIPNYKLTKVTNYMIISLH